MNLITLVLLAYAGYRLVKGGYISVKAPAGSSVVARAIAFAKSVF